jgi:hypothetical protein
VKKSNYCTNVTFGGILNRHGHFRHTLRGQRCRDYGRWTLPCHTVPISHGSTAISEKKYVPFIFTLLVSLHSGYPLYKSQVAAIRTTDGAATLSDVTIRETFVWLCKSVDIQIASLVSDKSYIRHVLCLSSLLALLEMSKMCYATLGLLKAVIMQTHRPPIICK